MSGEGVEAATSNMKGPDNSNFLFPGVDTLLFPHEVPQKAPEGSLRAYFVQS